MAVGQIGLGVNEFYDLTFDEFAAIAEAYHKMQEQEYRNGWEQTRFIAYHAVVPHTGKRKIRITDIARFHWERQKVELPNKETLDKMFPPKLKIKN